MTGTVLLLLLAVGLAVTLVVALACRLALKSLRGFVRNLWPH
jgi:hypothetical protein